jgi:adenylate cyclase
MKRRMAAILVADVVGYSTMMEVDEIGAARRLKAARAKIDSEIAKTEGRLFKAMGDSVLVEFASPIHAVQCAVGIRACLALEAGERESPLRMRFGLHLADVLIEGEDVLGEGVNLAARIQQAADPDTIDVSGALFEQIRRNSPFAFDDRGERTFKNIVQPVRVYRVRGEMDRFVFQLSPTHAAPVRPKRPHSLAVMQIESSPDEDQKYLAEGLTEELILELGRFRRLFLISRSATRVLSGAGQHDPFVIGERFGVRYVLGGTVRQLGSLVRLGLTLSETETGAVVWTDRLNESLKTLVERLEEIVSRVASTVLGRIEDSDIAAARRVRPESMTAYDFYLRGLAYHRLGGVIDDNLRRAVECFERAIEADENFGRPLVMWVCASANLPDFDLDDGENKIRRALELDANEPEANRIMGAIMMIRGKFDAARTYHERAMALSPSDAYIKGRSAAFYNFVGEPETALKVLDEAAELDPFLHTWCIEERVAALYTLSRLPEAIGAALDLSLQTRRSRLYRAAAHAALGEWDVARDAIAEAVANAPGLTTEFVESQELYRDRDVKRRLLDLLVGAGLPRPQPVPLSSMVAAHTR